MISTCYCKNSGSKKTTAFATRSFIVTNEQQQHLKPPNKCCPLLVVVSLVTGYDVAQKLALYLIEFAMLHEVLIFGGWPPLVFRKIGISRLLDGVTRHDCAQ